MLLWLYAISASFSAVTLIRQRGAADPRALFTVLVIGAVAAVGVMVPVAKPYAFWAGTAGFVGFMLAPGLLVRFGRHLAKGGSFGLAGLTMRVATALFPAAGFRAERDLYIALQGTGGVPHPAAAQVRARIASLSGGPMCRAAPATLALIIAILLAYALLTIVGDPDNVLTLLEFGANHAPLVLAGEVHRLMTAIFLHGGLFHLSVNVLSLWVLGRWVEPELGSARTVVVLLLSGLIGNVLSFALYRESAVVAVGASGAAMGLIGCLAMLLLRPGGHPMRSRRLPAVLVMTGATLFLGLIIPRIDNGAHLGGLVTGAALGFVFTRVSRLPDKLMRALAAVLALLAVWSMVLVGRNLPEWREQEEFGTKAFTLTGPAGAAKRVDERRFELSWDLIADVGVRVSIELVDPPENPAERLNRRLARLTGVLPPGEVRLRDPRTCTRVVAEDKTSRTEIYLIEDASGERGALLSFHLPADDPIIHDRWVEPILTSFRFR